MPIAEVSVCCVFGVNIKCWVLHGFSLPRHIGEAGVHEEVAFGRGPELTTQPDHVIFVDSAYFGYAAGWPGCDLGQILINIGCPFPSMLSLG